MKKNKAVTRDNLYDVLNDIDNARDSLYNYIQQDQDQETRYSQRLEDCIGNIKRWLTKPTGADVTRCLTEIQELEDQRLKQF